MLKAMMPGQETKSSGPLTRLSLTETDEGTISVKWREGDKINLCFVCNDGTVVRTASNIEVTNISDRFLLLLQIRFYNWIVPGYTIGTSSSATKFDFKTFMGSRGFSLPISITKLVP